MRNRALFAALVLVLVMGCGSGAVVTKTATPVVSNPAYLGQKAPGEYPLRFAAGVIRGELHTAPTFSTDGTEAYWSNQGAHIQMVRLTDGKWSEPTTVSLTPTMSDYRDPYIAPGGQRMYFLSYGRLPGSNLPEKENVWYVDRLGSGWGEPVPVSEGVNAHELHWLATANSAGDLYFAARDGGPGDIYCSRYRDGRHQAAERLGETVNKPEMDEMTPFVAPDGSYLLFARTDPKNTSSVRLYVSYAGVDGQWTEGQVIERVPYGLSPIVSPDGQYLFFLSSPNGVSWMSAAFIEQGRPAN